MKRNLSLLLLFIFSVLSSYQSVGQQHHNCATDEATNEAMKNNPAAVKAREELEQFTKDYTKQVNEQGSNKAQGPVYIIPIVFHVMHTWGGENISDAQIYDAVRNLNDDFRKLNADTANVVPAFAGIIADVEFEIRLAHIDPNGNCTNGIVRYYDPRTEWDRTTTNSNGYNNYTHTWNPTKYLNIYLVKSIIVASGGAGIVVGYTYLPGTWSLGNSRDAIVYRSDFLGSIGTSSPGNTRSLTHEIGHWFNLQHTWGSTNSPGVACGDDLVFDTPETQGSVFTCNLAQSVCNPPIIENVQNNMDYSDCPIMFTEGQKTRMRAAALSGTGGRNNLWSVANLAATGTDGASPQVCTPIPYLNDALRTICEGGTLNFNHISMNMDTTATTFLWDFPGGTPSSSTLENPNVTYSTAGNYDVSLTITNIAGSATVNYPAMVSVYTTTASISAPYSEGFESITFPGTDYDIDNMNNGNTWAQTTTAAATGTKSIYINNWGGNFGTDVFVTPSYNFSGVTNLGITFKLAFKRRSVNADDRLQVFGSTNCGSNWVQNYSKYGASLATTTSLTNITFIPIASEWRTESLLAIGSYVNQPNVRFKFVYTYSANGNYGNNLYIDDININGTAGINETFADEIGMWLSPNPTDKSANLTFTLMKQGDVNINVLDVTGRSCSIVNAGSLQPGDHSYEIGNNLSSGVYFVELINNGSKAVRKLIVE